jgi:serine/threonine protein kinase
LHVDSVQSQFGSCHESFQKRLQAGEASLRFSKQGELLRSLRYLLFEQSTAQFTRLVVGKTLRRLEEESRICGGLQHPGVPPVHELGRLSDGRPFLAMKLVEGETLAERLAQRPDPTHELAHWLGVFEQICQAVAYAHAQGVIHRDLKPANVMVGAFGEVQIMDWGLAKRVKREERSVNEERLHPSNFTLQTSQTLSGSLLGTPAYMSPEQAHGTTDETLRQRRCRMVAPYSALAIRTSPLQYGRRGEQNCGVATARRLLLAARSSYHRRH